MSTNNQLNRWKRRAQMRLQLIVGLMLIIALLSATVLVQAFFLHKEEDAPEETTTEYVTEETTIETVEFDEPEVTKTAVAEETTEGVVTSTYLGEYTITYYCACERCCGSYGANRPTVNAKPVVLTSTGNFAQEGMTVAVDPNKIPYGSLLYIEGVGYRIAQDCGGAIKGNRIDVYMESHQGALQGGRHESKVYIITTGGTTNEQK